MVLALRCAFVSSIEGDGWVEAGLTYGLTNDNNAQGTKLQLKNRIIITVIPFPLFIDPIKKYSDNVSNDELK